jgi:hypothetical protein
VIRKRQLKNQLAVKTNTNNGVLHQYVETKKYFYITLTKLEEYKFKK